MVRVRLRVGLGFGNRYFPSSIGHFSNKIALLSVVVPVQRGFTFFDIY